jgi:hypothetical protein
METEYTPGSKAPLDGYYTLWKGVWQIMLVGPDKQALPIKIRRKKGDKFPPGGPYKGFRWRFFSP